MKWIFGTLLVLALLFLGLWQAEQGERRRMEGNFYAALDTVRTYRVRDSLFAVSSAQMQLKLNEYKALRASDAELIRAMGLRLRRVQSVAKLSTESHYILRLAGDSVWQIRTPYLDFAARHDSGHLSADFLVRDTLIQVLHRVPRFTFLGIWFGTKGVRQEIISKNPSTQIVAAEYIKIVR